MLSKINEYYWGKGKKEDWDNSELSFLLMTLGLTAAFVILAHMYVV